MFFAFQVFKKKIIIFVARSIIAKNLLAAISISFRPSRTMPWVPKARQDIMKDRDGYYTLTVKYVDSWSPVDPNTLVSRRSTVSPDEVRHYFTMPYLGDEEIVDPRPHGNDH